MNAQPLFVTGYLPELDLLREKRESGVRQMREDCAVLSVEQGFRPIAYRLAGQKDSQKPSAWLVADGDKRALLQRSLQTTTDLLLLAGEDDCVLLFCGLLEASGTVFSVRAPFSAVEILRALRLCGRICTPIGSSPTCDVRNAALSDELLSWLEEILFYTDRIFGDRSLCAMTRSLLISEFLGCRTDRFALPSAPLPISPLDDLRLTAFLLCVFLSLRTRDGRLTAALTPPDDEDLPLVCCVHLSEPRAKGSQKRPLPEDTLPFLSLSAFRGIHLSQSDKGLTLEASFPVCRQEKDKVPVLHSLIEQPITLSVEWSLDRGAGD